MKTTSSAGPAVATADAARQRPRDVRTFWRVLLAILAPLPMLGMGPYYILSPVDGDASFRATVAAYAADPDRADLLMYLQLPFLALVPATYAVVWATRRHVPRLATAGAVLALTGFITGFGTVGGLVTPAALAASNDLDVAALADLDNAHWENPIVLLGSLLFILGLTLGLLLLGIALWRSRVAPAWTGWALALGGLTHPFMPGHTAAGIGLLVTSLGFTGATYALLRMPNDAFDLPPVVGARRGTPEA